MSFATPTRPQTIPASLLYADTPLQIAPAALSGRSVSGIAADHDVSRKFVYQQLDRAHEGIDMPAHRQHLVGRVGHIDRCIERPLSVAAARVQEFSPISRN